MGRGIRIFSDTGIYHIMFRGVNKQDIFLDNFDYKVMLDYIAHVKRTLPFELYAYCLMKNHVHFLIKENNIRDISLIMKKILVKYALYFNNKYNHSGHVFENRYKSKPVNSEDYLFASLRYIHQNPVNAHLCEFPKEYEWSSYKDYFNKKSALTDKEFILNIINLNQFKRMHQETDEDYEPFDTRYQKLHELKRDIASKYNIDPPDIAGLAHRDKIEIIKELRKQYSLGAISTVTGIKKSTLSSYKIPTPSETSENRKV